jgi:hypothetical protein
MSDSSANFSFPHRTPVFSTVLVLLCFALFGWLALRYYAPRSYRVDPVEGFKTPVNIADNRKKEQAESTNYGWVDAKAGVVRLPLDRAIELTVQEHAKK